MAVSELATRFDADFEIDETGPSQDEMYAFVKARESGARTYANSIGVVIEKGRLARVTDSAGKDYLDCLSCAGTLATGHNHPYILAKVEEFLQSGHVLQALDMTTPAKYRFLVKLLECLPPEFARHVRFQSCGPSGADAVEAALKLFKTATGRRTVLAFHGAYHGMTAGALALTGNLTAKRQVASIMPDVHFLPYPYSYRCPFGLGGEQSDVTSLAYIERMLTDPESGVTAPAAMIVEAIQGEGGVIPASAKWLRGIREITARLDIPLIIDEIQTGFGRTGDMFAFEHAGIVPDAVVISKAVGGGFPLSMLLYHEKYDTWQAGAHAGTFRGNQIAMVAGAACLEVIQAEQLVAQARAKGNYLETRLRELACRFSILGDIRGRGLMWGIEVIAPDAAPDAIGSYPADGAMARTIKQRCLANGLIIETGGRHSAVLRLLPPLIISEQELDEAIDKLSRSIQEALG
ncbi:2,4-diaminobutyrate 4-transaminase family protein [Collimonas pratensis]|uniref:2,4-diaminobutyrate 4-transaminase family protein n=2 Tax=Collimonas pratensis TaxID=279113 RepID=A0ABM5Z824_9BURK|nr:2,4-diaminobutyrate 4-transaminase family protein [Collimonas pratensis]